MIDVLMVHRRKIGVLIVCLTVVAIAIATLPPSRQLIDSTPWCLVCGTLGGVDVLLNVLMFTPLGFGLALAGARPARAIPAMCLLTLSIEIAQMAIPGRDPTISDLMTNSLGGAIGFAAGFHLDLLFTPRPAVAARLSVAWFGAWAILQIALAYIAVPAPTESRYYGQIKRALGFRRPWPGSVVNASINDLAIPNTAFSYSTNAADMISSDSGARFDLVVVPRGRVNGLTSIVRIADSSYAEIAMIGQDRSDLVFGVRTRGIDARLRPAYFAMRGAFSATEMPDDTVHIQARHSRDVVTLSVTRRGEQRELRIPVTPAASWRRFMPARVYADGSTRVMLTNAVWVALCLLPGMFWFFAAGGNGAMHNRRWIVFALVLAGATTPFLMGLALPGLVELAGFGAAMLLGFLLGRGSKSRAAKPRALHQAHFE